MLLGFFIRLFAPIDFIWGPQSPLHTITLEANFDLSAVNKLLDKCVGLETAEEVPNAFEGIEVCDASIASNVGNVSKMDAIKPGADEWKFSSLSKEGTENITSCQPIPFTSHPATIGDAVYAIASALSHVVSSHPSVPPSPVASTTSSTAPRKVIAVFLRRLFKSADDLLGKTVEAIVVTVPASVRFPTFWTRVVPV
ncbi:hypothetical protein CVT24_011083 [Panaeolus cyanescens]|uniref:Uncharacterized protein n=1 Tax=Panaeolus cyanescens TaxID=181874 RepID=A0A409YYC3_9AGAR|nr:hypothetical protein CVT24_011083 [Panaeolus cyanescens]